MKSKVIGDPRTVAEAVDLARRVTADHSDAFLRIIGDVVPHWPATEAENRETMRQLRYIYHRSQRDYEKIAKELILMVYTRINIRWARRYGLQYTVRRRKLPFYRIGATDATDLVHKQVWQRASYASVAMPRLSHTALNSVVGDVEGVKGADVRSESSSSATSAETKWRA